MSQRFLRCPHCGLPHAVDEASCPITGRPIEARRSVRPGVPPVAMPAMVPASVNPTARGGLTGSPPPPAASQGRIAVAVPSSSAMPSAGPAPFETTPPPSTMLGQLLGGKYRVLRVIGEGGMGSVYECEHAALHRKVAIKVLHPAQARKKASVQRFHHEAQVAGAIGHPNICEIYDIGEGNDGAPFLVMELLHGETLADRIASEGALAFDDVVEIISQVLSGLIAAHEKGIIHRDIKPENVFLSQRTGIPPLAKLLDFGISKVAGADELNLTRTGMVMGTPFYMSPEQARGDRALDHRVDIYATGVMMYECLTGRRPFTAANYNALLVQILTTGPRPPHELRPAVPESFEEVVLKAMARERDRRFRNAAEMQKALVALRDPIGAGAGRRIASIPPEPVPLVKRTEAAPATARGTGPRQERELQAISVDLDRRALLDSDEVDSSSGSIEIPIVTDDVRSVPQPPPSSRSRPLYRPEPVSARPPEPERAPPRTPSLPPRPTTGGPASVRGEARPPTSRAPIPRPLPQAQPRPQPAERPSERAPSTPGRTLPPPLPSTRKPRMITPTPTPVDPRVLGLDSPWRHDHAFEGDPTEVGSLPLDASDPTEVGMLPGRRPTDTPIDADSTERIDPPRMARLDTRRARTVREVQATSSADPRREDDSPHGAAEHPEDEAPTTLFDRRALKPNPTGGGSTAFRSTTERAPAPRQGETPKPPAIPRAPRRP